MNYTALDCPRCEFRNEVFLSGKKDEHLRQCANCNGWVVIREAADAAEAGDSDDESGESADTHLHVEELGMPPQCPVDACGETLPDNEVAVHVIESHDGSLD